MPLGIICSTRLLGFLSDSLQIKVVMGQLRLMKYIMHFKCNLDWSLCSCAVYVFFFFTLYKREKYMFLLFSHFSFCPS